MNDLPTRLRTEADGIDRLGWRHEFYRGETLRTASLMRAAADEIERLREALTHLIPAAQAVVSYDGDDAKPPITDLLLVLEAETVGGRAVLSPASSPIVKTETST